MRGLRGRVRCGGGSAAQFAHLGAVARCGALTRRGQGLADTQGLRPWLPATGARWRLTSPYRMTPARIGNSSGLGLPGSPRGGQERAQGLAPRRPPCQQEGPWGHLSSKHVSKMAFS